MENPDSADFQHGISRYGRLLMLDSSLAAESGSASSSMVSDVKSNLEKRRDGNIEMPLAFYSPSSRMSAFRLCP